MSCTEWPWRTSLLRWGDGAAHWPRDAWSGGSAIWHLTAYGVSVKDSNEEGILMNFAMVFQVSGWKRVVLDVLDVWRKDIPNWKLKDLSVDKVCTSISKHLFDSFTTQERVKKLLLEHQEPLNQGTGSSLGKTTSDDIDSPCAPDIIWLVVTGTWLANFPIYWECHHPNWLQYFSEGLKPPTSNVSLPTHRWTGHDGSFLPWQCPFGVTRCLTICSLLTCSMP